MSAPQFVTKLQDVKFKPGSAAQLVCRVSGQPPASVKWLKDGVEIGPGDTRFMSSIRDGLAVLDIESLAANSAGAYECQASNRLG